MASLTSQSSTLGNRLRSRREELGWSVEDLSHEISLSPKYIHALERDDYGVFSAKVYALGFLKKVLTALSFENKEEFLKEFANEWDVRHYRRPKEIKPLPQNRGPQPYLTPRRLGLASSAFIFLLFLGYTGVRFISFVSAPELMLEKPENLTAVHEPLIQVRGSAEKESQLMINGRAIMLDKQGNFDEVLELAAGVNTLEFVVRDRFGKETKALRYVLVK